MSLNQSSGINPQECRNTRGGAGWGDLTGLISDPSLLSWVPSPIWTLDPPGEKQLPGFSMAWMKYLCVDITSCFLLGLYLLQATTASFFGGIAVPLIPTRWFQWGREGHTTRTRPIRSLLPGYPWAPKAVAPEEAI